MTDLLTKALARRSGVNPLQTTVYRLVNGAGDGLPGITIDRLDTVLLIQSEKPPSTALIGDLHSLFPQHSIYFRRETPHVRQLRTKEASPQWLAGPPVHEKFPIQENGLTFLVSVEAGYSVGIFLDQRENRRRVLEMDLRGKTLLNTFAYTCAFSVCAAKAGAMVTSIDLSRKYLDWGRENFHANHLDDTAHDFIYGDVFDWLPRLAKKGRRWDVIILDPPTFSTSKIGKVFQAVRDYPRLLALARSGLAPHGRILACMNTHEVGGAAFRKLTGVSRLLPLPPDFIDAATNDPPFKSGWTV